MTELPAPLNVRAKATDRCRIKVAWERPVGVFAYYFRLYMRKRPPASAGDEVPWVKIAQDKDLLEYTTDPLEPITTYEFRVQSYTLSGDGPLSEIASAETAEAVPASAPCNLRATSVQLDSITVAWDPPLHPNGTVVSYLLYIDEVGKDQYLEIDLDGATTTHYIRFLERDTAYRFQVCALNGAGEGPLSDILSVRTLQDHRSRFLRKASKPVLEPSGAKAHTIRDVPSAPVSEPQPNESEAGEDRHDPGKKRDGVAAGRQTSTSKVTLPSWVPQQPPKQQKGLPKKTAEEEEADRKAEEARRAEQDRAAMLREQIERAKSKEDEFIALMDIEAKRRSKNIRPSSMYELRSLGLNALSEGVKMSETPTDATLRKRRELEKVHIERQLAEIAEADGERDADSMVEATHAPLLKSKSVKSLSGTIRGKRHGVKSVIGAFTQTKRFESDVLERLYEEEKDNTIVLYVTTTTAIRSTYSNCQAMINMFRLLGKKIRIKNINLDARFSKELAERFSSEVTVPQAFVNFNHLGDLEAVSRLNETGKLKEILANFEDSKSDCSKCGGNGFYPCTWCFGSKKSIAISQFVPGSVNTNLKCTVCNENGLQRCEAC